MRVYHLIKGLGRGGAEMLLPYGIRASTPDFMYAVGYFLPDSDALVQAVEDAGATTTCFNARTRSQLFRRVPAVARDVLRFRADVIHCHLPLAGVAGRLAGRLAQVPVVYTEHNLQPRYHPLTFQANRLSWPLQERVIACSEDVARSIHNRIGHKVPVQVVQNGVATELFTHSPEARVQIREANNIPVDAPVMATVASFRTQKRLVLWLEVAKRVLQQVPDARFIMVGDGEVRPEVEAAIQRLNLSENVLLPGSIADVRPWLSAADVYVMTSEFEGLPIALLEAMSCELPAACTAVGGIGEVIRHGIEGALAPRDSAMDLVPEIVRYLQDADHRKSAGAAARARVVSRFGMQRMMGELEAIYREIVQ